MKKWWGKIAIPVFVWTLLFFNTKSVVSIVQAQNCTFSASPKEVSGYTDELVITVTNISLIENSSNYTLYVNRDGNDFPISNSGIHGSSIAIPITPASCSSCFTAGLEPAKDVYIRNASGDIVCNVPNLYRVIDGGTYIDPAPYIEYVPSDTTCIDNTWATGYPILHIGNVYYDGEKVNLVYVTWSWDLTRNPVSVPGSIVIPKDELKTGVNQIDIFYQEGSYPVVLESFNLEKKELCPEDFVSDNLEDLPTNDIKIEPQECVDSSGNKGLQTSLGCIPYESGGLIGWLLKYGISIGGGIAFLLMAWGTFLFTTSKGDQEKVKQGKEIITSALAGLIFIIFSVFLLSLIGVQIFKIPGFSN